MEPVKCVFPFCDNPARKHGNECRRCYYRIQKRKQREKQPPKGSTPDNPIFVSLDNAFIELERRQYHEWYDGS